MKKKELMDAMMSIVDLKNEQCEKRLCELDPLAKTERSALPIQNNIYQVFKTFIAFAGTGNDFPAPFTKRLNNLLTDEADLRRIYDQTNGDEKASLAVYLFTMLSLRVNFRSRYQRDIENAYEPQKQIEAKMKLNIIDDLLSSFRKCYSGLGGRTDLNI